MNTKIEKTLEFDKIKNIVKEYAISDEAKNMILSLKPISDATNDHNENEEVLNIIQKIGLPSFSGLKNINQIIKQLSLKSTLTTKEILDVSDILTVAENFLEYIKNDNNKESSIPNSTKVFDDNQFLHNNLLSKYFEKLSPLTNINNDIKKIIISEDIIADNATHTLAELRSKRKILENRLHNTANSLLNTYKDYLQEMVVTQKNGKYCLPVKSEFKSKVPGMLQDQSSTSLTLFIEPMQIVEMNNSITKILLDEQIEINKILDNISKLLFEHIEELQNNIDILIYLDFIFAKGKFHKDFSCTKPIINNKHYINLKKARHPLIKKEACVPLDVYLGKEFTELIITGPNTGGKTVVLKTIGLIELMALSGLFIPCFDGSEVSTFDEIFADIGDEQSIEQSLSTFSSHMKNDIFIIDNATQNSLCLFDELGAGTDPTEGATLAISILEYLKNKNATVVATTHYPELKMFALSEKNVSNASLEFNIETLKPTYKLLIGLPGKSNAFLISEKLGLNKQIIENAKNKLSKNDIKFEDVVSSLNESKIIIENEKTAIENYKKEISELKLKVKRQQKGLQDREESIIRKAKEQARDILQNAQDTANTAIKNIKQYESDIQSARDEKKIITEGLNNLDASIFNDELKKKKGPTLPISPKKIKVGDKVHVLSLDQEAEVLTLPDKDFNVYVRCGILRTKTNLRDLEFSSVYQSNQDLNKINNKKSATVHTNNSSKNFVFQNNKSLEISPEINVIGQTTDEALATVEKYLDDAYLSNISQVKIIHGRGTGALKNIIHKYLKKLTTIKEFHPADVYDGGDGATVVVFN